MISRRGLITGLGGILAAPAIVRTSSLMPVKVWHDDVLFKCTERILGADHGYVAFFPKLGTDPAAWMILPAGERIYAGDFIEIRGGSAYRFQQSELGWRIIVGMAAADSS